jgi:cytochrome c-type biogenesis protein CcmH
MPHRALIPILLGVLLCVPVLATEAGGEEADWSYEMWNDLMSPFCPGRTLADCPSDKAEDLRRWIVDQEALGRSAEDVHAEVLTAFGDVVRQAPVPTGLGLAAYVIPILLFLAGGGLVGVFMRRQSRASAKPAPVVAVDPDLQRELDEEIGRSAS